MLLRLGDEAVYEHSAMQIEMVPIRIWLLINMEAFHSNYARATRIYIVIGKSIEGHLNASDGSKKVRSTAIWRVGAVSRGTWVDSANAPLGQSAKKECASSTIKRFACAGINLAILRKIFVHMGTRGIRKSISEIWILTLT